jgi:hypothetical protein
VAFGLKFFENWEVTNIMRLNRNIKYWKEKAISLKDCKHLNKITHKNERYHIKHLILFIKFINCIKA